MTVTDYCYRSDLPNKLTPQIVEHPESRGVSDWFRRGSRSRGASDDQPKPEQNDTKQPTESTSTQANNGEQSSQSQAVRPHLHQGSSDRAPLMAESAGPSKPDTVEEEPEPAQPQYLRRRFSDLRGDQDILEVWFAGNHGDVGGGWRKANSETWPLSHQPLI
jgi:hypothetical protein